jgi:general stress protein CsbA
MELPFTPFEATSITILLLAASYYAGHWIGFKVGALETIKFFEDQGYIEFDKEEEEEDEDSDRED